MIRLGGWRIRLRTGVRIMVDLWWKGEIALGVVVLSLLLGTVA
jgi:hypothetical protein